MTMMHWTTTSLILGALALPTTIAQFGPGVLVAGEYATVTEFTTDAPLVQNVPLVEVAAAPRSRVIDLAICLDTSGSMEGLIDSAKQRIWAIVNDLALATPAPELRVALLTYGNDGHDAENGWVNIDCELTGDLDEISRRLFALRTNGGTELVGRVLSVATGNLRWSDDPNALKLAVVAGNESADQDRVVSFRDACAAAIGSGILVNSIYCGNPGDAEAPLWKQVSLLADGRFATIDHQSGTLVHETPFDAQLVELTTAVNGTYLPFGQDGQASWANQAVQDENAINMNPDAAANRAMCKNGALYVCGWDLVDASQQEGFDLAAVEVDQLPEDMRAMTLEQRAAHIETAATERAEIQRRIADVGVQRQAWIDAETARLALDESRSFDHQIRAAIRAQVTQRGFRYPAPANAANGAAPANGVAPPAPVVAPAPGASQAAQGIVAPGAVQRVGAPHGAAAQNGAAPGNRAPQQGGPAPLTGTVLQAGTVQQAEAMQQRGAGQPQGTVPPEAPAQQEAPAARQQEDAPRPEAPSAADLRPEDC